MSTAIASTLAVFTQLAAHMRILEDACQPALMVVT
jgi:hypothetical protein